MNAQQLAEEYCKGQHISNEEYRRYCVKDFIAGHGSRDAEVEHWKNLYKYSTGQILTSDLYKGMVGKKDAEICKLVEATKKLTDHIESMDGAMVHGVNFPDQIKKLFKLSDKAAELLKPYQKEEGK